MPSLRWTGPVDKISVLLTIKIVVHLMTWSLTPAQTTGKCWSVLQMTPALIVYIISWVSIMDNVIFCIEIFHNICIYLEH